MQEIDAEMDARLAAISASAPDEWSFRRALSRLSGDDD